MKNNKGFTVSIVLYSVLIVTILVLVTIMSVKSTTYKTNKTVTSATKNELTCQDKLTVLEDELTLLKAGKVTLAAAITAKGVATTSTDSLEKMATNVGTIATGKNVVNLGNGGSFNVSAYPGYATFTNANFLIVLNYVYVSSSCRGISNDATGTLTPTASYNASTGVVTITPTSIWVGRLLDENNINSVTVSIMPTVYLIY